MSVKKMGSKLAQGVRQVKAQQAPAAANSATPPAASVAPRAATKPGPSSTLHPSRVWPD